MIDFVEYCVTYNEHNTALSQPPPFLDLFGRLLDDSFQNMRRGKGLFRIRSNFHHGLLQNRIVLRLGFLSGQFLGLLGRDYVAGTVEKGLFAPLVAAKLYSNHGHHADQARWQSAVERSEAFFSCNSHGAINNALVGFVGGGSAGLCDQTGLDGVLFCCSNQRE